MKLLLYDIMYQIERDDIMTQDCHNEIAAIGTALVRLNNAVECVFTIRKKE